MVYSLEDLVNLEKVKAVMEMFYDITGIPSSILDMEGNVLVALGWQRICSEYHRVHPETLKRCVQSDTELSKQLHAKSGYACYRCLNGLVDMAVPIIIEGTHKGNLFSGQFFFTPPDKEFFKAQAIRYGFDMEEYLQAMREVPVFRRERMEKAMQFLAEVAALIAEIGLAQKKLVVMDEELEYAIKGQTDQLREEIRSRKRAEVAKAKAYKLEGVLEMAGAASHEFSQPLQALQSDAQFLMDTVKSGDIDVNEALESVLLNVQRLAELVVKVQHITRYEVTAYTDTVNIVDINKASD